jgi:hypothetical protein
MAMISIRTDYPIRGKATPRRDCVPRFDGEKCSGTTGNADGVVSAADLGRKARPPRLTPWGNVRVLHG